MRVAVKVGYDGRRFHGSQVQPGVPTVHSALAEALRATGHEDPRILWAGRTDAGVSAAGNVAVFETRLPASSLLPGLTFRMEGAWAWALAEVDAAFDPRKAKRRRYRYHLRTDRAPEDLADALAIFEGTHDFTGFARLEPGVEPRRTVLSTSARREGPFVVLDVVGESFVWNQVRRMVSAAERVASGRVEPAEIRRALAEGARADHGTAPPEPLVLIDVEYDGLVFAEAPAGSLARLDEEIADAQLRLAILGTIRSEGGPA